MSPGRDTTQGMPETPPPAGEAPAAGQVLPLAPSRRAPSRRMPPRRPLPDAVAVRRIAVPESAPPYDDELPADGKPAAGQAPPPRKRTARAAGIRVGQPGPPGEPRREPSRTGGQAAAWPSRFAQVLAETLAGSRPPRQITPWTTEQARRQLRQLGPMLSAGQQPRVRRVMTSCPASRRGGADRGRGVRPAGPGPGSAAGTRRATRNETCGTRAAAGSGETATRRPRPRAGRVPAGGARRSSPPERRRRDGPVTGYAGRRGTA